MNIAGEAGVPLPRGSPEITDFVGWVLTPSVPASKVAAFPQVVVTGDVWQRLAPTRPARRSRAYPQRLPERAGRLGERIRSDVTTTYLEEKQMERRLLLLHHRPRVFRA